MTELAEFLLARITEDEAAAARSSSHSYGDTFANDYHGSLLVQPDRIRAECEAKRAIVDAYKAAVRMQVPSSAGMTDAFDIAVKCLAEVYGYHADYRQEWGVGEADE